MSNVCALNIARHDVVTYRSGGLLTQGTVARVESDGLLLLANLRIIHPDCVTAVVHPAKEMAR